jgi:hypothetical protein
MMAASLRVSVAVSGRLSSMGAIILPDSFICQLRAFQSLA